MSSITPITGHCLCGQASYSICGEPAPKLACFCTNCQHAGGSAFAWLHGFMRAGVVFEITKGQDVIKKYEDWETQSGCVVERCFYADTGKYIFIHVGTIDGEKMAPEFDFFVHNAPEFCGGVQIGGVPLGMKKML